MRTGTHCLTSSGVYHSGPAYADALVGFEHKAGGLTVPKGGVVVLEKHFHVVVSTTEDMSDASEEERGQEDKARARPLASAGQPGAASEEGFHQVRLCFFRREEQVM